MMGTRSITVFKNEDNKEICVLYRQFDGYPSGMGKDLKNALANGRMVNGYNGTDTDDVKAGRAKVFNGMGDLVVQTIVRLKCQEDEYGVEIGPGNYRILPAGTRDCWENYMYTVTSKDNRPWIIVESNKLLFEGFADDFDSSNIKEYEDEEE